MNGYIVIAVVGLVAILLGLGFRLKVREVEVSRDDSPGTRSALWILVALGLILLLVGVTGFVVTSGPSPPLAPPPPVTATTSAPLPPSSPGPAPSSPPLDEPPLAEIFPQAAERQGKAFVFRNNAGVLHDAYSDQAHCHRTARPVGLQLRWDMSAEGDPNGGWGVWWDESFSGDFNASRFTTLALSVKGAQGDEIFQVGLKDRSGKEVKVESKDRVVITDQAWRRLELPLAGFDGVDLAAVANLNIGFNKDHGAGQICIDEITFR